MVEEVLAKTTPHIHRVKGSGQPPGRVTTGIRYERTVAELRQLREQGSPR